VGNKDYSEVGIEVLEILGLKNYEKKYRIPEPIRIKESIFKKDYFNIILNPYGAVEKRCLNDEKILEIINLTTSKIEGSKVYINVDPNRYKKIQSLVKNLNNDSVEMLPLEKNILDVSKRISECDLVISVDTGIVHIASAHNKSMICIYNSKSELKRFPPKGDNVQIILKDGGSINNISLEELNVAIENMKLKGR
ncbi:MAG: glycosyltransferase family 9 protein, partial [Cetobacterium sp.]